jgi:hypothetical protein
VATARGHKIGQFRSLLSPIPSKSLGGSILREKFGYTPIPFRAHGSEKFEVAERAFPVAVADGNLDGNDSGDGVKFNRTKFPEEEFYNA